MSGVRAVLQALSELVERVRSSPGAHGGLTHEHVEAFAVLLGRYIETRFEQLELGPDKCREMGRLVIIQQQAQRHAAVAAVDVRARDNPFDVEALTEAADNCVLDGRGRGEWASPNGTSPWSSAEDDELVARTFHEADSHAVVAVLKELRRRNLGRYQRIIETHLELAEELGREPHLRETAWRVGTTGQVVEEALLRFKNLLVEMSQ